MESETMDLEQLASFLRRDARELNKLANRGQLPGQRVGGVWRFSSAEIQYWVESQIHGYTDQELTALEESTGKGVLDRQPLLSKLLSEATMAVPLRATTRSSVLRELVNLAEQSWQVYDPDAVLDAIKKREEIASTALENGVAIPHPRRVLPGTVLGEPVLAYARSASGIPFGAPGGQLTDIFFLVLCNDQAMHLSVLARLSRLLLRPGFLDDLRAADTADQTWKLIESAEQDLLPS